MLGRAPPLLLFASARDCLDVLQCVLEHQRPERGGPRVAVGLKPPEGGREDRIPVGSKGAVQANCSTKGHSGTAVADASGGENPCGRRRNAEPQVLWELNDRVR